MPHLDSTYAEDFQRFCHVLIGFSLGCIKPDVGGGLAPAVFQCRPDSRRYQGRCGGEIIGREMRGTQSSHPATEHARSCGSCCARRHEVGYRAVVFRLVTGLERWCPIDGGDPIVGHLHGMPHSLLMRKRASFPPLPVSQRRTRQTSHRRAWVASVVVDRVTYVRMLCCGTDPCPTGLTTMSRAFWGRNRQFGYACIVVAQAAHVLA